MPSCWNRFFQVCSDWRNVPQRAATSLIGDPPKTFAHRPVAGFRHRLLVHTRPTTLVFDLPVIAPHGGQTVS